jgi:UDP-N-acetyl-D-mannosaminuronate dehydrogenase
MVPILERESGMTCGVDFAVGYSPERVNPGDEAHTIDRITKVIVGVWRYATIVERGEHEPTPKSPYTAS